MKIPAERTATAIREWGELPWRDHREGYMYEISLFAGDTYIDGNAFIDYMKSIEYMNRWVSGEMTRR